MASVQVLLNSPHDKWVLVGEVGVDSGQVVVVDPCYVSDGLDYDQVCDATEGKDGSPQCGTWDNGAVASGTAWGDGSYPVVARLEGNRVQELRVLFDAEFNDLKGGWL